MFLKGYEYVIKIYINCSTPASTHARAHQATSESKVRGHTMYIDSKSLNIEFKVVYTCPVLRTKTH